MRELKEETGHVGSRGSRVYNLGRYYIDPSRNSNYGQGYLVFVQNEKSEQKLDENEEIQVVLKSIEEIQEIIFGKGESILHASHMGFLLKSFHLLDSATLLKVNDDLIGQKSILRADQLNKTSLQKKKKKMKIDITEKYGKEMDKSIAIISSPGKGLLAADESTGTIGKRFKGINVENTEKNRQQYRQLLFSIAKESSKYIGGVIMYTETLFQKTDDGVDFTKVLTSAGIVPGIKVDLGQRVIPGTTELRTQGINDIDKRIKSYYDQGARFAKWRASFQVSQTLPSELAIEEQCIQLARYAALCQQNGLVPIVEPEVLVVVGDHDAKRAYDVTQKVLVTTFYYLNRHNVNLSRIILKPNMILAGRACKIQSSTKQVAEDTLRVLRDTVPSTVPSILFLSGGQTEDEAAQNLNAINTSTQKKPWYLSFSYGRALQAGCLKAWLGKKENEKKAQEVYMAQAKKCYLAALGKL